jgi:hypothetical protein
MTIWPPGPGNGMSACAGREGSNQGLPAQDCDFLATPGQPNWWESYICVDLPGTNQGCILWQSSWMKSGRCEVLCDRF